MLSINNIKSFICSALHRTENLPTINKIEVLLVQRETWKEIMRKWNTMFLTLTKIYFFNSAIKKKVLPI